MEIVRIDDDFSRWSDLLDLIRSSFAYMDGVIDPPSSVHRLTPALLAQKARDEVAFVATSAGVPVGCIFCLPETDCLYLGKFAVAPELQGTGLGRRLMAKAEEVARARGLRALRLETRVELKDNHALFVRWGFTTTTESAHPGFGRATSVEMRKLLD
ncbi:GNAT family N-acetyltransferase [Pseudorhizobium endolithicum]|uniref:GNAT family N-acetyltransferase n=1 Tax=Pseudorhizobium endolithicum TaxID=1191678 RepID=UPI001159A78A|nr:GNAT family N-acetyltransferase [Pseudorhizobium endolithicum]